MRSNRKPQKPKATNKAKVFNVPANDRTREQLISEIAVEGVLANAGTVVIFSQGQMGEGDIMQAVESLRKSIQTSEDGDLSVANTLLIAQATALNAIFHEMARRCALNIGEHLDAADAYMRLALKAQSQCRATLESLAKIKNPPNVAFVKQANIAHGPQQVNNGTEPGAAMGAPPRAHGKNESAPIELLENDHGEWLDTRAAGAAGKGDPQMATVGKVSRTEDGSRKDDGAW